MKQNFSHLRLVILSLILAVVLPVRIFAQVPPGQPLRPPPAAFGGAMRGFAFPVVMNVEFRMNILPSTFESCPVIVQMMEELDKNNDDDHILMLGEAPIRWLASSFSLDFWKPRHARWEGNLSGEARACVASGVISQWNGRRVRAKDKHLQIYFRDGSMTLDLNLDGFPSDVFIQRASVNKNGKPIWSWGKVSNR